MGEWEKQRKKGFTGNFEKMDRKNGYTLIEVLVYIAIFAVTINFVFQLYYTGNRMVSRGREYSDALNSVQVFLNGFKKDVRNSSGKVPSFGDFQNSEETLILQLDDRVIIYTFNRKKEMLEKLNIQGGTTRRTGDWQFADVEFLCNPEPPETIIVRFRPTVKGRLFKNTNFSLFTGVRNEK